MLFPKRTATRDFILLDGTWRFQRDANREGEEKSWYDRLPQPESIAVPGSWNSQGVDTEEVEFIGTGWYENDVFVPSHFTGKTIILYVGAVCARARLWVNGAAVAGTEVPFLPFVSDVTEHIRPGTENRISHGRSKRGVKSIIAPIPMKMRIGNNSFAIPRS